MISSDHARFPKKSIERQLRLISDLNARDDQLRRPFCGPLGRRIGHAHHFLIESLEDLPRLRRIVDREDETAGDRGELLGQPMEIAAREGVGAVKILSAEIWRIQIEKRFEAT